MRPFEYVSPTGKNQATRLLSDSWGETEILAGGTDLLSLMKDEIVTPKRLVNIRGIEELRGIRFDAKSGLRLGALVTIQELLDDPGIQENYPAIFQAAEGIRSPQIRSMGTVGGDLCQRPRCWYFRNGFGLLAKSMILDGDNRYHAILGNSGPAYFVNPSSLGPPLIAFGASVRIWGPKGDREIPLERFFVIPDSEEGREFDLRPNEIIAEILVPAPDGMVSATYEVRQREALDWPLATASVALRLSRSRVRSARVVLGHVAPIPWVSREAEEVLKGRKVAREVAELAGNEAMKNARSLSRNGYKIQLARVATKRAILGAIS